MGRPRVYQEWATALGETPFWPVAAVITSATLYVTLPSRFIAGPNAGAFGVVRWVVPVLTALLLAALVVTLPGGGLMSSVDWAGERLRLTRRWLTLALIAILSAANGASILLLVHLLLNGGHANASPLLRAAVHLWIVNVLLFALWYWQLDGGGPRLRPQSAPADRDFLFPQQTSVVFEAWKPLFLDYLFVSFTNAAAFSPTDTLPLDRWAKMLMLAQSAISLTLAVMVVARAVNILH